MGRFKILICFILITFLLSGCWDFQRIRNRMFISGIAIEKEDKGYIVGIESLNLQSGGPIGQQQGGGQQAKVTIKKVNYPSIEMPLHSVQTKVIGEPFYSNIQILIIGKKQAEEGIAGIISHFLRDPDMRRTTPVVLAENPIDILKVRQKDERFISHYIKKIITLTEGTGRTIATDIGGVSRAIHENNINLIPYIKLGKNKQDIEVSGVSVLKKGKVVGHLSEKESIVVAFIQEIVESGSLRMDCPDTGSGSVSMDIIHTSTSLKPKVSNGNLIIGGNVKAKGYLAEYTCGDGNLKGTTLHRLEKDFTKLLQNNVQTQLSAIYEKTGEDVLNVKSILKKNNPDEWEKIKSEYDSLVKSAIIDVKVSVELILKGTET
ncbi:Ger(x)C family spore germination protein [Schinkia sp. CFF1]